MDVFSSWWPLKHFLSGVFFVLHKARCSLTVPSMGAQLCVGVVRFTSEIASRAHAASDGSPADPFPVSPLWVQVEVKPYVLDDQMCDECQGTRCGGKFAPFFCANVTCLQYYCEYCWASIHSRAGREFHKPLVKEGGDRPRHVPFRWS
jgi:hypothetical protein